MAYLALYRRFRPKGFDGIVGQDHIVKIIKNQIRTGDIGHAYLFCGSRGTGKTSIAKIFGRAVNCLTPEDGSPCGKCEVCKALDSGSLDVIEIDAASNNGVDEIREIREKVQYPPVNGKYKVYIIDEVHMLSAAAFNALLKTLEEPPAHIIFILATTEVHKLPATILSRCMRFDFKLVGEETLTKLLCEVFNKIDKPFELPAVKEIARAAEGSVRDSLSIADMCVSVSEGKLTYKDVLEILAASDRTEITALGDAILAADVNLSLIKVDKLCSEGKNVAVLNKDLTVYFRDLLVIKSAPQANNLLGFPEEIFKSYQSSAKKTTAEKLIRCIEIFSSQESIIRYSLNPKISFEAATVKASLPSADNSLSALLPRIAELEKTIDSLIKGGLKIASQTTETLAFTSEKKSSKKAPEQDYDFGYDMPPPLSDSDMPFDIGSDMPLDSAKAPINTGLNSISRPVNKDKLNLSKSYDSLNSGIFSDKVNKQSKTASDYNSDTLSFNEDRQGAKPSTDISGKSSAPSADAIAIWGGLIRYLRQNKPGLLYTVCSNLNASLEANTLIIFADDNMSYDILSMQKNIKMLEEILNSGNIAGASGSYSVRIAEKGVQQTDNSLDEIKKLVGDKLIIKD